jgi:hypothetical protein
MARLNATRIWKALDRIRKPNRWLKGGLAAREDGVVQRCLIGTLLNVNTVKAENSKINFYEKADDDPECQLVSDIIKEQFPERVGTSHMLPSYVIPAFNDHEYTTHDDVILVLEKAAIQCDEVLGS